eukprot:190971-Rhodomonas_salina.3
MNIPDSKRHAYKCIQLSFADLFDTGQYWATHVEQRELTGTAQVPPSTDGNRASSTRCYHHTHVVSTRLRAEERVVASELLSHGARSHTGVQQRGQCTLDVPELGHGELLAAAARSLDLDDLVPPHAASVPRVLYRVQSTVVVAGRGDPLDAARLALVAHRVHVSTRHGNVRDGNVREECERLFARKSECAKEHKEKARMRGRSREREDVFQRQRTRGRECVSEKRLDNGCVTEDTGEDRGHAACARQETLTGYIMMAWSISSFSLTMP